MSYHIAVDLGASSGRLILGDGTTNHTEVHRFANDMVEKDGQLCWDVDGLFHEIETGLKKCREMGKTPKSIGVDTWGVDFVLLDGAGNRLGNAVAYRDRRTVGIMDKVHAIMPEVELYKRTGVLSQAHNTMFQLFAMQEQQPDLLEKAVHMLMLPDYFHYRLCGVPSNEYTIATTTGLINPFTRDWDRGIIEKLGLPGHLFGKLTPPGTVIGEHAPGFQVIAPAGHDTASAVAMAQPEAVYISSGTWSLIGICPNAPILSEESLAAGFTNEGGYNGAFRYCKNSMGLWMIQCVRRELNDAFTFAELCEMAEGAEIASIVECDAPRFFAPENMSEEIRAACKESGQEVPDSPNKLAKVVYQSLAVNYDRTIKQLEALTGKKYDTINIIGGGAKADYLNRLTALHIGKKIIAGPYEATAMGNLTAQAKARENS